MLPSAILLAALASLITAKPLETGVPVPLETGTAFDSGARLPLDIIADWPFPIVDLPTATVGTVATGVSVRAGSAIETTYTTFTA